MIIRAARKLVRERLKHSPAVAVTGPRQCGKTTLAQSLGGIYFDLEQESERLRLDLEWEQLAESRKPVILDEAQEYPSVFARLRGAIDSDRRRKGRFLLLGSVSPGLMRHVSESLAGRLALVELTPFLPTELPSKAQRDRRWLCGGFPEGGVLAPRQYPRWQRDYIALLTQRDLPNWGLPAKPQTTLRMLRMLAAIHGQTWNASQLGKSLGLSYQTVNSYLDYMLGAFLVRLLPSYQVNIKKRLVKSPKIYWRDSGLLHAMLNVPNEKSLLAQPWVGASWEGHVIESALATLLASGRTFEAYYFRTSDQHELDLVLDLEGELWAVEVKLTSSPGSDDMRKLDHVADMIRAKRRVLVSRVAEPSGKGARISCNLERFLGLLRGNH
jgi:predicted AAA+ superfamily ATPase